MAERVILLVGGGSGGHVTPLLAVAEQLKAIDKHLRLTYVGEKGGGFVQLAENSPFIDDYKLISAGKFRRYHGVSVISRLFDFNTFLLNIRDVFRVLMGFVQSFTYLLFHRPTLIFIKGGFVGVPIGMAARLLRIPYYTHDSDTMPGLANRLISGGAQLHFVAMSKEFYPYPAEKTKSVGLPLGSHYRPYAQADRKKARHILGLSEESQIVFVTGGSLGAQRLNDAVVASASKLLKSDPKIMIVHNTGAGDLEVLIKKYSTLSKDLYKRVKTVGYISNMYDYYAAADVVVCRAGATTIAEAGAIGSALLLVPNPQLTGGHQTKNALNLQSSTAAEVVSETDIQKNHDALTQAILDLLKDTKKIHSLRAALSKLVPAHASTEIAKTLISGLPKK